MKRLQSAEHPIAELEVVECDTCGYHMGVDATFLDQVEDFCVTCPGCQKRWYTGTVITEDGSDSTTQSGDLVYKIKPDPLVLSVMGPAGVCTKCLQPIEHDFDEPFAHCACGTMEWTGEYSWYQKAQLYDLSAANPFDKSYIGGRWAAIIGVKKEDCPAHTPYKILQWKAGWDVGRREAIEQSRRDQETRDRMAELGYKG